MEEALRAGDVPAAPRGAEPSQSSCPAGAALSLCPGMKRSRCGGTGFLEVSRTSLQTGILIYKQEKAGQVAFADVPDALKSRT